MRRRRNRPRFKPHRAGQNGSSVRVNSGSGGEGGPKGLTISGEYVTAEIDEFRNGLREMEKETEDAFSYTAKNEGACY